MPPSIFLLSWYHGLATGLTLGFPLLILLSSSTPAWSQASTTPSAVVERWLKNYPDNLEVAAELTTLAMRHFKPPEEWATQMHPALSEVKFHYVEYKILTKDIQGKRAVVTVEALISTIAGSQFQKEEYILLQVKEEWLINSMQVLEERFLGQVS